MIIYAFQASARMGYLSPGNAKKRRHLCGILGFIVTMQELDMLRDNPLCVLSRPNKPVCLVRTCTIE